MKNPNPVDTYIAQAPKELRARLRQLRAAIKAAAPEAIEKLSYGMPYYSHKGRLAYFRHWKAHIGLYLPTPTVQRFKDELAAYETNNATIRFPHDKKLPIALIKKLIKARAKMNEARKK